ncbi:MULTISPECIES: hypothetical protein [Streptomyces]|uniref:Serine/threonine protein kinase n=1 Tax=Streptomyces solicathayae TaxID=3081768 RepID=A0ABZ0LV48_9ACTN|nr:hypothetical protein [Streptomyces sp. HUAS YS2]WOX23343.1 hypothetical protein R2D22_18885 [Streptomyces sp. HUAS YS2]
MNLRVIGLGAAVVCAVLVPLAAFAGPAGGPAGTVPAGDGKGGRAVPGGLLSVVGAPERAPGGVPEKGALSAVPTAVPAPGGRSSACGPELSSPDGIEAQTCVLTENGETWGRTYYRNASGLELTAVLTLMAPGGRTVQTYCEVSAEDEPGACETPRERSRASVSKYSAVAEFAGAGEGGSTPLLLRSGSNAPAAEGS